MTIRRKHAKLAALAVAASSLTFGLGAGTASAAHCTDNGGPGNSDFAAHVKANAGNNGHNEGQHRGWSSCQPTSANYVP